MMFMALPVGLPVSAELLLAALIAFNMLIFYWAWRTRV